MKQQKNSVIQSKNLEKLNDKKNSGIKISKKIK